MFKDSFYRFLTVRIPYLHFKLTYNVSFVHKREEFTILSNFTPPAVIGDDDVHCCIVCDDPDQNILWKVSTVVDNANLKHWAKSTNKFDLLGKLIEQAADAHAGDTYYLRDSAHGANRSASVADANYSL